MKERIASAGLVFLTGLVMLVISACGGGIFGVTGGELQPCPASPNCVSSFAKDERHAIAAIEIEGVPHAAWRALEAELESRPHVEIVTRSEGYLHAVFTTKLMRYRDDVEFYLRPAAHEIALRSTSRMGYGDMGANRDRIESIRAALVARGAARPEAGD